MQVVAMEKLFDSGIGPFHYKWENRANCFLKPVINESILVVERI